MALSKQQMEQLLATMGVDATKADFAEAEARTRSIVKKATKSSKWSFGVNAIGQAVLAGTGIKFCFDDVPKLREVFGVNPALDEFLAKNASVLRSREDIAADKTAAVKERLLKAEQKAEAEAKAKAKAKAEPKK